jgi:hypothetical protein
MADPFRPILAAEGMPEILPEIFSIGEA